VTPKREWKVLISAAESSNEMVLEGIDGLFGNIGLMHMWCHKLKLDIALGHELLKCNGCFIV
jgi:hypothetical protein